MNKGHYIQKPVRVVIHLILFRIEAVSVRIGLQECSNLIGCILKNS